MTAGVHEAGGGGGVGASSARGVIVIVAAVAVGLLLMWRGLGEADTQAVDAGTGDETATADDGTATDGTTTDGAATDDTTADGTTTDGTATDGTATEDTTAPVAHAPAEVTVLVLNGTNGIMGVAGRGTEVVAGAGFATAEAKNADVDGPSVVLYVEGYEADAIAVAQTFSVDPAAVVQPFDPATSPIADTQGAHVIVRVGNDGLIQV